MSRVKKKETEKTVRGSCMGLRKLGSSQPSFIVVVWLKGTVTEAQILRRTMIAAL